MDMTKTFPVIVSLLISSFCGACKLEFLCLCSLCCMLHAFYMANFSCKLSSIILDFTTHLGSTNNLSGDFANEMTGRNV